MRKCIIAIIALLCSCLGASMLFAGAGTWTKKADFGGSARRGAVGFSIGSKGYIGMGDEGNYSLSKKDFWEYDPAANTWTQKADFGGTARSNTVGFSIGSKGYIGTGGDSKDFWEYDPAANAWTQKADCGGGWRSVAIGFSIGSKGYIGTGIDTSVSPGIYRKDLWEYDPAADTWTQKADLGGTARILAVGFSIGSKGYIGTGVIEVGPGSFASVKDFWEYDPAADAWTQKADFGGTGRSSAVGFSIGSKGYIGTGGSGSKDFWEYDPAANAWTQKADFGGTARSRAKGFSIGNKGYIGTGWDGSSVVYRDFWEYDPSKTAGLPFLLLLLGN
jgi:N-acetylneuraminic acid mutarotase